jgi:hypothetical protein
MTVSTARPPERLIFLASGQSAPRTAKMTKIAIQPGDRAEDAA